jgi:hypothetical protein
LEISVSGSAWACLGISNELRDAGMQFTCMHSVYELLESEFRTMQKALNDIKCIDGTPIWHDNAATTIKCVQEACHKVAAQVRDTIQGHQMWSVVAPDQMYDGLYALAISLQEQQMTLELLTVVVAFVNSMLHGPGRQYRNLQYVERFLYTCES